MTRRMSTQRTLRISGVFISLSLTLSVRQQFQPILFYFIYLLTLLTWRTKMFTKTFLNRWSERPVKFCDKKILQILNLKTRLPVANVERRVYFEGKSRNSFLLIHFVVHT